MDRVVKNCLYPQRDQLDPKQKDRKAEIGELTYAPANIKAAIKSSSALAVARSLYG